MPLRPHTDGIDDIKRRPDGVFLNWKERVFHILEFTRPYDSNREDLLCKDENKRNKYQPMHSKIMAKLQPHSWRGEVIALSVGVRGTILEDPWQTAIDKLDVPKTKLSTGHHVKGSRSGTDRARQDISSAPRASG